MDVKLLQDIFFKLKHIDEDENWLYTEAHCELLYDLFSKSHCKKIHYLCGPEIRVVDNINHFYTEELFRMIIPNRGKNTLNRAPKH